MQVICDVQVHGRYSITSRCRCHPAMAWTGHKTWVRVAVVDFHDGIIRAITARDYKRGGRS